MSAEEIARRIVAAAVGLPESEISRDSDMFTVPGWDSMAHMRIILAAEEHLGAQVDPEFVAGLASVGDLVLLLRQSRQ